MTRRTVTATSLTWALIAAFAVIQFAISCSSGSETKEEGSVVQKEGDGKTESEVDSVAVQAERPEDAKPVEPSVSLTDTDWKLQEMNGEPARLGDGQKKLHLLMNTKQKAVQGYSGCNRYTGSYEVKGSALYFGPLDVTRMECMGSMELEQQYLEALGSTKQFDIRADTLWLYEAGGATVLRFVAASLE